MATIAARDALRSVELAETVAVIGLLATAQAVGLRGAPDFSPRTPEFVGFLRQHVDPLHANRRQDLYMQRAPALHRDGRLPGLGRGDARDPTHFATGTRRGPEPA